MEFNVVLNLKSSSLCLASAEIKDHYTWSHSTNLIAGSSQDNKKNYIEITWMGHIPRERE
jgi:hypothetical protein